MQAPNPQLAAAPSAAPAPASPGVSISEAQAREALGAAGEVLNGAASSRILELADKLALAKVLLRDLANGSLVFGRPQGASAVGADQRPRMVPSPGPIPPRRERRAAAAVARRKSAPGK